MASRLQPQPEHRLAEALDYAGIEEVSWRAVAPDFIEAWDQGEQLVLLGKTGRGKSTYSLGPVPGKGAIRVPTVPMADG